MEDAVEYPGMSYGMSYGISSGILYDISCNIMSDGCIQEDVHGFMGQGLGFVG